MADTYRLLPPPAMLAHEKLGRYRQRSLCCSSNGKTVCVASSKLTYREKPHCYSFISFFFLNFDISVKCPASMRLDILWRSEWQKCRVPACRVCACVRVRAMKDNSRNTLCVVCADLRGVIHKETDGRMITGRETENRGGGRVCNHMVRFRKTPTDHSKPTPVTNVLF